MLKFEVDNSANWKAEGCQLTYHIYRIKNAFYAKYSYPQSTERFVIIECDNIADAVLACNRHHRDIIKTNNPFDKEVKR